jgi:competence protein ComFC
MWNTLLELFFPDHCVVCGSAHTDVPLLCASCQSSADKVQPPFCQICSRPFSGEIPQPFSCPNCVGQPFSFACAVAPYRSRGVVRELVHRFKYTGHFYLRHVLARWASEGLSDPRLQESAFDAVVPVPLHPTRQRERGFNQASALAELLSQKSGIPLLSCLRRIRYTETQTQFDRSTRLANLKTAFSMRPKQAVAGKNLLLVDDVLTTGATLDECARVLLAAGAETVKAITVARG